MSIRIQIVLDPTEREAYRRAASREGLTLSAWLRRAARERLRKAESRPISSPDDLRTFFQACDAREQGVEPDWADHLAVMDGSRRSGRTAT